MISWMQNWETVGAKTRGRKTAGQMTIPRELILQNGRLHQRPVRELFSMAKLREEKEILVQNGHIQFTTDFTEGAVLLTMENEERQDTVLLDRFSMELFSEPTGRVSSESFAKEQHEWMITLPEMAAGERVLKMKKFLIA